MIDAKTSKKNGSYVVECPLCGHKGKGIKKTKAMYAGFILASDNSNLQCKKCKERLILPISVF